MKSFINTIFRRLRGTSIFYLIFLLQGFLVTYLNTIQLPVLLHYLNLASNQVNTYRAFAGLGWGAKFLFSFITDSIPICGYRRLPYILIGLTISLCPFVYISVTPQPEPYYVVKEEWCSNSSSNYFSDVQFVDSGRREVNNANSPNEAVRYTLVLMLATMGVAFTDCVIDGLVTQLSQCEPEKIRGRLITQTRIGEKLGRLLALLLVGATLNSASYGGTFCMGMEFNETTIIISLMIISGAIYAIFFTNELDYETNTKHFVQTKRSSDVSVDILEEIPQIESFHHREKRRKSAYELYTIARPRTTILRSNLNTLKLLIGSPHYQKLLLFILALTCMPRTTADSMVERNWLQLQPVVRNFFTAMIIFIEVGGVWLYSKYCLNFNWRYIIIIQGISHSIAQAVMSFIITFNYVRSQFFWFADDILFAASFSWIIIIISMIIIEYAPTGLESFAYALCWTVAQLGQAFSVTLSNWIFGYFKVNSDERFRRDSSSDRRIIMLSYSLSYIASTFALISVVLIPSQKKQAAEWRKKGRNTSNHPFAFALFLVMILLTTVTIQLLSLVDSTKCLRIAGGQGC